MNFMVSRLSRAVTLFARSSFPAFLLLMLSSCPLRAEDGAPVILVKPQNVWTNIGGSGCFSVVAMGEMPLNYQWRIGAVYQIEVSGGLAGAWMQ